MANYSKVYRSHYNEIKKLAKLHFETNEPNSKKYAHGFNSMWTVYTVLCVHRTFGRENAHHNKCSFSLSGLATASGLGKATVQKAVSILESANLIHTEKGKGYAKTTSYSFPKHESDEPKEWKVMPKQAHNLLELMKDEGVKSLTPLRDISQRPSPDHDWHPRLKQWVTAEEMKKRLSGV